MIPFMPLADGPFYQQIINALILTVLMSFMTAIGTTISQQMQNVNLLLPLKKFLNRKWNVIIISYSANFSERCAMWTSDIGQRHNLELIEAVLWFIHDKRLYSNDGKISLERKAHEYSSMSFDNIKEGSFYYFQYFPYNEVVYGDFRISFSEELKMDDKQKRKTSTITVRSRKNGDEINAFIEECLKLHYMANYNPENVKAKFYYQVQNFEDKEDGLLFSCYSINNYTTFDTIFFPEKEKVVSLVDKVQNKELNKLSLLLYGEPGCGKTSIIKAIMARTGRSVIHVKISCINSDEMLMKMLYNESVAYFENNDEINKRKKYDEIPMHKKIFIFEDFDAESKLLHKRKKDQEKVVEENSKEKVVVIKDSGSSSWKPYLPQLTMSGVLNALDGCLELNGAILIFTTNHLELIDPAIIRQGRMTLKLKMGKMRAKDAQELIYAKFRETLDNIPDDKFTPAELSGYCDSVDSIEELKSLIF